MDNDYLDFGSDSDSDSDNEQDIGMRAAVDEMEDSDEEDKNDALVKLLSLPTTKKSQDKINMDDFEAEMEAELDKRAMEAEKEGGMEHQRSLSRSSSTSSLNASSSRPGSSTDNTIAAIGMGLAEDGKLAKKKAVTFAVDEEPPPPGTVDGKELYDPIYFDSDESDGDDDEKKARKRSKREYLSNDDLFYDPNSDAADQEWVDNKRRDYCTSKVSPDTRKKSGTKTKATPGSKGESSTDSKAKPPLGNTDAVLNCPACFTVLCLDCQRHEFYTGQYRAMFAMNCVTDRSETLIVPLKESKSKKRDKNKAIKFESGDANTNESDKFFPVKCKICTTQVAVFDHGEVYHFFNVLSSHP